MSDIVLLTFLTNVFITLSGFHQSTRQWLNNQLWILTTSLGTYSYCTFFFFNEVVCCSCCCKVTSVVSDSVRPHRRKPTRLLCPWDSLGKNTGVGCHFLLQSMKVKSKSEVAQSCPTLSDLMDCSLWGSFVHGISQARVLEWGAIAFSEHGCEC